MMYLNRQFSHLDEWLSFICKYLTKLQFKFEYAFEAPAKISLFCLCLEFMLLTTEKNILVILTTSPFRPFRPFQHVCRALNLKIKINKITNQQEVTSKFSLRLCVTVIKCATFCRFISDRSRRTKNVISRCTISQNCFKTGVGNYLIKKWYFLCFTISYQ